MSDLKHGNFGQSSQSRQEGRGRKPDTIKSIDWTTKRLRPIKHDDSSQEASTSESTEWFRFRRGGCEPPLHKNASAVRI